MSTIRHLRENEPFNLLPDDIIEEIRAAATLRTFPANCSIFRLDNPPTGYLYVIRQGLVEISALAPGGGDMVIDFRKEGQFFGGTPIFTGAPYSGSARTVRATECYLIPEAVLKKAWLVVPEFGAFFTRVAYSRVRRLYADIVADHARSALAEVEAYPFKKRLSEIMSAATETVAASATITEVAQCLARRQTGAVVVVDDERQPVGIITERDLVTRVLAHPDDRPTPQTAAAVMNHQLHTMGPETYMYEAMAYMLGHRLNQLLVVDQGEMVGIVTQQDLMRYRSQKAMLLLGNVREEQTIAGLATIRRELLPLARTLLSETRGTPEVMEILTYIHHGIIRRVYELCLAAMHDDGLHPPAIRHTFLVMGSCGRREMLLAPDQDHAFIFEDVSVERLPEIEAFFAPLAERLVAALETVGYPRCEGNVMASNRLWRGRLCDWKERISEWLDEPEPQKVRDSSIFFDFTPLLGDAALASELRSHVMNGVREFPGFLYHMMTLDLRYKVPLGLMGRFLVEKAGEHSGMLSLKQGGSVYIVDCLRMFSLEQGITCLGTLERLQALVEQHVLAAETAEHIRAAFEALTFLRLRNEITLLEQGKEPDHFLNPKDLGKNEQDLLREAFAAVSKLQDATKRHFGRTAF